MAKSNAKPSNLSEEFVQESSDEADETLSGTGGQGSTAKAATNGDQSSEFEASEAETSASESESEGSQDDRAPESEPFSKGQKRSSDAAASNKTPLAKRPKKRCVL